MHHSRLRAYEHRWRGCHSPSFTIVLRSSSLDPIIRGSFVAAVRSVSSRATCPFRLTSRGALFLLGWAAPHCLISHDSLSSPRSGGRSVASALARERQVSPVRAARPRSLSRDVAVASRVQEDAWSRAVEWGQVPNADPSPPEPDPARLLSRRPSSSSGPPAPPAPPPSRAAIAQVSRVESPLASGSGSASSSSCLLYTSPSPRDKRQSRMPSSA